MRQLCPQTLFTHEPPLTADILAPSILKPLSHSNYPESWHSLTYPESFRLLLSSKEKSVVSECGDRALDRAPALFCY